MGRFDSGLLLALRDASGAPIGPHWLQRLMTDVTALGGGPVLTLATIMAAGYLIAARRAAAAVFLILTVSGGAILADLLKSQFLRPRPDLVPHLAPVSSASFPSAHAMNSAVVYLTLAAVLARTHIERRLRRYIVGAAILLVLLIGCSRIWLGVHWPSDVLAGWLVGGAWALLCFRVDRDLQRRGAIEPPGQDEAAD